MMDAIHIGRLRARYHVRGDAAHARERLDAVLRRMLDEALETAVARLGLPDGEEVCVRTLRAPARLSLDATDASVAATWSVAIADALREAIASGQDVVRFRSRRHGLLDLVRSAALGDLTRAWAWAQLELCDASVAGAAHAGSAIADALCLLPDAAPAAVVEAARHGALPALVARLSAREWERVARAALGAFGADESAVARGESAHLAPVQLPVAADAPARARAARIAARSALAEAVASLRLGPESRRMLLALAALAAEPESLVAHGPAVLAALERLASPGAERVGQRHPQRAPPLDPKPTRPSSNAGMRDIDALDVVHGPAHPEPPETFPVDPRPMGRTRAGGLLYLLHLVEDLGLPESLCAEDGPLATRSLRFVLHTLALALIPIEPRDPAALAFCGLAPDDEPPSERADRPTEAERAALDTASAAIAERLRLRLDSEDQPARAVLLQTCGRDAEVVADPAWVEVRFALEDADLRVRRAGLDLDPGWLPWLGCVVRFVYA